jgi:hypothetical protein
VLPSGSPACQGAFDEFRGPEAAHAEPCDGPRRGQLDAYVADRVKQLTGGVQHPIMIRPPTVPDFPIALVAAKK